MRTMRAGWCRGVVGVVGIGGLVVSGGACLQGSPEPVGEGGPAVEVKVAPLQLQGIGDACYGVTVYNGAATPEMVWQRTGANALCATRFGNADGGDISYVGPCDADEPNHTVELVVESLSDTNLVPMLEGAEWQNPCPASDPCELPVVCVENADTPVTFNLTLMRRAQQGFFDLAVNFNQIFCSAKLDCTYDEAGLEPIDLLFNEDGDRDQTVVAAVACTAGPGDGGTELHLNDVRIVCGDGAGGENQTMRLRALVPTDCIQPPSGDHEYLFAAGAKLAMSEDVLATAFGAGYCFRREVSNNTVVPSPWTSCEIETGWAGDTFDVAVPTQHVAADRLIGAVADLVPVADIVYPDPDADGDEFPVDPAVFFTPVAPAIFRIDTNTGTIVIDDVFDIAGTGAEGLLPLTTVARGDDLIVLAAGGLPFNETNDVPYYFYKYNLNTEALNGPVLIERPADGPNSCQHVGQFTNHLIHFQCEYVVDPVDPNSNKYSRDFLVNLDGPVASGAVPMVAVPDPAAPSGYLPFDPAAGHGSIGGSSLMVEAFFRVARYKPVDGGGMSDGSQLFRYHFTPGTHTLVADLVTVVHRDDAVGGTVADDVEIGVEKQLWLSERGMRRVEATDRAGHVQAAALLTGSYITDFDNGQTRGFVGAPAFDAVDNRWELRTTTFYTNENFDRPPLGLWSNDSETVSGVGADRAILQRESTDGHIQYAESFVAGVVLNTDGFPGLTHELTLPFPIALGSSPFVPDMSNPNIGDVYAQSRSLSRDNLYKAPTSGVLNLAYNVYLSTQRFADDGSGTPTWIPESHDFKVVMRVDFNGSTAMLLGGVMPHADGDMQGLLGPMVIDGDASAGVTAPGVGCDWHTGAKFTELTETVDGSPIDILQVQPALTVRATGDHTTWTHAFGVDANYDANTDFAFHPQDVLPVPGELMAFDPLPPSTGGANLLLPGGASAEGNALQPGDPRDAPVFQYAYYHGTEALTCNGEPCNKVYATVAVGFDPNAVDCRFEWEVTASQPGTFTNGASPAGSSWPVIVFRADLTGDGTTADNLLCTQHPLNGPDGAVSTGYTPVTSEGFQFCWDFDGAAFNSYCPADMDYTDVLIRLFDDGNDRGGGGGGIDPPPDSK